MSAKEGLFYFCTFIYLLFYITRVSPAWKLFISFKCQTNCMVKQKYDFNIVSLNVKGLNNLKKRKAVFRWITRHKFDLAFLQETHSNKEIEHQWKNEWAGQVYMSHGSRDSKGCMIMIRQGLDCETLLENTMKTLGISY